MELEEIALLVQLVGMAVEEHEDALQLGQGVVAHFHDGRLVCLDHGHGADRGAGVAALAVGGGARRRAVVVVGFQGGGRVGKAVGGSGLPGQGRGGAGRGRGARRGSRRGRVFVQRVWQPAPLRHEGEDWRGVSRAHRPRQRWRRFHTVAARTCFEERAAEGMGMGLGGARLTSLGAAHGGDNGQACLL